jgi:hypothetical protein
MKINIVINVGELVREKVKYGFALLSRPLRAEIIFSDVIQEDTFNIFYGNEFPSIRQNLFCVRPSNDFEDCLKNSKLPDISNLDRFELSGKQLPRLFPVSDASIDFDIAAATFMLASEFQDLISLERDEFDRLRAMDSLQDKLGVLNVPVVNYYSLLLKKEMESCFDVKIESRRYDGADFALALTHDVDCTSSLNLRMIKRNIFGHAILNNEDFTLNERALKLLYPLIAFGGYNPPKIGLKFLRNLEVQKGLRSTFFIKTGATGRQDVNYNYHSRSFRNFIDSLTECGFEIGIHPSMKTYIDGEQFIAEKTRLEKMVGNQIDSVRQHYLKFTASKTTTIWENAGMKHDSTLGFSRKAGFRNSVAFPFPLYNFQKDRISSVTELPLLIMDGTFADSRNLTTDQTLDKMKILIDETKAVNGAAAILFHNSLADPIDFPGYKKIYDQLLTEAADDGFRLDTLSGIIENFR